jgi:hypothetical protein
MLHGTQPTCVLWVCSSPVPRFSCGQGLRAVTNGADHRAEDGGGGGDSGGDERLVNDMAVMAMAVVEVEPSCEERRGPVHDNIKVSDGQVSHDGSNPDHLLRRRWRQQNQKAHS